MQASALPVLLLVARSAGSAACHIAPPDGPALPGQNAGCWRLSPAWRVRQALRRPVWVALLVVIQR
ncbi:hypothetical protein DLM_2301 [Aquitalea magnusonii]|uniref:Secreted protein n=1 Tax=Aquitalea magnusonii TaxID=332411 RepID=A0A3G9GKQ1_9NEIS|nr:hypothetical protein DLM_2301 [Aquitalea magnusonii]